MSSSSSDPADSSWARRRAAREARGRFEEAWREGRRRSIESLLSEVTEAESGEVLRQLLDAEIRLRVSSGDAPTIEDYGARFPGQGDLVSTVFEEQGLGEGPAVPPGRGGATTLGDWEDGETLSHRASGGGRSRAAEGGLPERVGRYTVLGLLGAGAFGRVYHALDSELNRQVAVKVPHPSRLVAPSDVEAYLDEARALARLDHPGVVPVYDAGRTDDGSCFVVSKLIRGKDLAERLASSLPSPREAAGVVAALAEALHDAHGHGLVHRDVKPRNILIDDDGKPYLVDFGLALREEDYGLGPKFAGTIAYMSPEQARGEGHLVDCRSDVFSLGVVFYELLTGERPFRGETWRETLEQIKGADPRAPRALAPATDRELERVCLKALSKRLADRYASASEMARDLRGYLAVPRDAVAPGQDGPAGSGSGAGPAGVVPKGLRCFDAGDADFFLGLLPGPRDRDGLPERLRFWKSWVEGPDAARACRVGVVYGPSGCGKSSMVRAGLIPRLDRAVAVVLVEAAPGETEGRLLAGLRARLPGLPAGRTLAETLAAVRRGQGPAAGRKLLIVIDQFEQWLHANPAAADDAELVAALRQCDGARVQCLLIVRDDFWMSLTRFTQELEVTLAEGKNCAPVDLFDRKHAAKVLAAFGRAFEALPPYPAEPSKEQAAFVGQAVAGLARDGRVVPIHLSLFAETVKGRAWAPATLRGAGGPRGVGVAFLDESFHSAAAPPARRRHGLAAREALKLLLPGPGEDIRGHRRARGELLRASGYAEGSPEFAELLEILDADLRLITPVDARGEPAGGAAPHPEEPRYQLTHDYLVSSIREWVTRQQLGTGKGRAELLLAERAALWLARPEPRYLPSALEWALIRWHTRPRDWSAGERRVLRASARRVGRWASLVAAALLALGLAGAYARGVVLEEFRARRSEEVLRRLLVAEPRDLPATLKELAPYRDRLVPRLERLAAGSAADSKGALVAALALLGRGPGHAAFLRDRLLSAPPEEAGVIVGALRPYGASLAADFWAAAGAGGGGPGRAAALRAGCALAAFAPGDPRWKSVARGVSAALVAEDGLRAPAWVDLLRPAREALTPHLADLLLDPDRRGAERSRAALALAEYLKGDVDRLSALVLEADPDSFRVLAPGLRARPERALALLDAELARAGSPDWGDTPRPDAPAPARWLVAKVEAAQGVFADDFAVCQSLPLDEFEAVARGLDPAGYRPVTFRPYASGGRTLVAAVWARDGRAWRVARGGTPDEIRAADRANRADGFLPVDLALVGPEGPYVALWCARGGGPLAPTGEEVLDTSLYLGVPEPKHESYWAPLNQAGFVPRTDFRTVDRNGKALYNSVRWKFKVPPRYADHWSRSRREGLIAQADLRSDLALFPADVRFDQSRDAREGGPRYASVWWSGGLRLGVVTQGVTPGAHVARFRELAASGHRPAALSVSVSAPAAEGAGGAGAGAVAASVWLLPVMPEAGKDVLARRKANAAAAAALLGEPGRLWAALRWRDDPRLKGFLVARLPALDVPPGRLVGRLRDEPDAPARRGLIQALAGYDADRLDPEARAAAVARLGALWRDDPDPGVHSAAGLALRRWGHAPAAAPPGAFPLDRRAAGGRGWYVDAEGQTMAVLRGPLTFPMGSPGSEDQREHHSEMLHVVTLDRDVAVATTEVTVGQYARFDPNHSAATRYAPEPDCPVNMVSWFDAARYCNWRSAREGIARDQWCYPDPVGPGARPVAGAMGRTGYRLPGDAEWEYAGRAGSVTCRPYGRSDDLLPLHAWTVANSGYRSWPVGRLLPNDFGLFDTLGNVLEWCHDTAPTPPEPAEGTGDGAALDPLTPRAIRGGSFVYMPSSARCAQRDRARLGAAQPYLGFRVVRTLTRAGGSGTP